MVRFLTLVLVALLMGAACSTDDTAGRESTREVPEGTLSSPTPPETMGPATTISSTAFGSTAFGGTTGVQEAEVLLRVEGDPGVAFSGICTADAEESVIGGQVPKRYRFDLNGQNLSCRIQKRDSGNGSLRVVLLSGNNTRSVQQTNSTDSVIRLSYTGG